MTVLYIDDDFEDYELFSEVLASLVSSVNIIWANTCDKALTLIEDGLMPDYIFVDGRMPVKGAQHRKQFRKKSGV